MATQVYKSSDAGAPILTGEAGKLVALLDAVLVGTAGIAYGAIPSAGWTKPFAATNIGVYRNDASTGSGAHLLVEDNGGVGRVNTATVSIYKSMTGTTDATGTSRCGGLRYMTKSNTTTSAVRAWILVADANTFYLQVFGQSTTIPATVDDDQSFLGAGDYASFNAGDTYNYFIAACTNSSSAFNFYSNGVFQSSDALLAGTSPSTCQYTITGTPTSVSYSPQWVGAANSFCGSVTGYTNPLPYTGNTYYVPAIMVGAQTFLGRLRGIYLPVHYVNTLATGTTVTGVTGLAGTSELMLMRANPSNLTSYACGYVEIVEDWEL